jgi:UDP-N-acetyl-D-glucosamine dehydrogenase
MPHFVVDKIQNALNACAKPLLGSHVHIMGVAYKRDIDDLRESPALDVIHLLKRSGARVTYSDPHVATLAVDGLNLCAEPVEKAAAEADCVVIVTDHTAFDYPAVVASARLIVDTRNALRGISSPNIVRL